LSLVAFIFFGKKITIFEKIERIRQIFCLCLLEAQQAENHFSLNRHVQAGCVSTSNDQVHPICKG